MNSFRYCLPEQSWSSCGVGGDRECLIVDAAIVVTVEDL